MEKRRAYASHDDVRCLSRKVETGGSEREYQRVRVKEWVQVEGEHAVERSCWMGMVGGATVGAAGPAPAGLRLQLGMQMATLSGGIITS